MINKLKKNRIKSIYLIISFLIVVIKCNIFVRINGFNYQGLNLYIISVSIFIIISILSMHKKDNNKIIFKIIKIISNQTSGIYYLHIPIKSYLKNYILLIKNKTLIGSLIIYLFCHFISTIGIILFKNTKLRHLFQ